MSSNEVNHAEFLYKAIFGKASLEHMHFDVERMAYLLAAVSSAELFVTEFPKASNFVDPASLLKSALGACSIPGLVLEFGVRTGGTIRLIASKAAQTVHGFDSFEGLPEDWTHFQKAGRFSTEGKLPDNLPPNARLHAGWFNETLPKFLVEEAGTDSIRFLHIDSDLYSSAKTVLGELGSRITSGTVIVFDDYYNYPNWQNGEFKAWKEYVAFHGIEFEYIGWASRDTSVAVKVI